jgi:hypothetical protein
MCFAVAVRFCNFASGVPKLYSSIAMNSFACSNRSQDPSLRQHVSHVAGIDVKV